MLMHKQVPLKFVLAYICWFAAFGVWLVSWIIGSDALGQLGVLLGLTAGTITLRLWMLDGIEEMLNTITIVREVETADRGSVWPLR